MSGGLSQFNVLDEGVIQHKKMIPAISCEIFSFSDLKVFKKLFFVHLLYMDYFYSLQFRQRLSSVSIHNGEIILRKNSVLLPGVKPTPYKLIFL